MSKKRILFSLLATLILIPAFLNSKLKAQEPQIRKPTWSGKFYPADPKSLKSKLKEYTTKARQEKTGLYPDKNLKALILPHAGYVYSAPVAAYASLALEGRSFSKIIILGPDHRVGFQKTCSSRKKFYQTPLGKIQVHPAASKLIEKNPEIKSIPRAENLEHSIEVVLPYLQYYLEKFQIIPLIVGQGGWEYLKEAIAPLLDSSTLLVVSTDLSHYLPYQKAVKKDQQTLKQIRQLDYSKLDPKMNQACGCRPIQALLSLAKENHWESKVLKYLNSGDTAGPEDRVVGYATVAFFTSEKKGQKDLSQGLSPAQGDLLIKLARQSIAKKLGLEEKAKQYQIPEAKLSKPKLLKRRGSFVTLYKNGRLRGCIGSLMPRQSLSQSVQENSIKAATKDPRFRPLSPDEFADIKIEVSVLEKPKPFEYESPKELLDYLDKNRPGVVLQKGLRRATYLPQVWEQLPDPAAFLSRLCLKAGLTQSAWKEKKLKILTYQVQYFEE